MEEDGDQYKPFRIPDLYPMNIWNNPKEHVGMFNCILFYNPAVTFI